MSSSGDNSAPLNLLCRLISRHLLHPRVLICFTVRCKSHRPRLARTAVAVANAAGRQHVALTNTQVKRITSVPRRLARLFFSNRMKAALLPVLHRMSLSVCWPNTKLPNKIAHFIHIHPLRHFAVEVGIAGLYDSSL